MSDPVANCDTCSPVLLVRNITTNQGNNLYEFSQRGTITYHIQSVAFNMRFNTFVAGVFACLEFVSAAPCGQILTIDNMSFATSTNMGRLYRCRCWHNGKSAPGATYNSCASSKIGIYRPRQEDVST